MALTAQFVVLLALSAVSILAQSLVTWAAFTYTYHGEKIPSLGSAPFYLTPLGAHQMVDAGAKVRARYIDPPSDQSSQISSAPINGLSTNAIDNSQLYILTTDDMHTGQSAIAFMQGLYPQRTGVSFDQQDVVANSSLVTYPLEGYQYPAIAAVSPLDFNHFYVAGNVGCSNNDIKATQARISPASTQEGQATHGFYRSLGDSVFSNLAIDKLDYYYAMDLYEYALFQANHNTSLYNSSDFTSGDLGQLESLAFAQQWTFNTPSGGSSIQSIAGQTLAAKVIEQFYHNIASNGTAQRMSILLGSFEPMLAFFSLGGLSTGPSASKFNSLPLHGSTMTFELYSLSPVSPSANLSAPFPDESDLRVRFLFRNGTSDNETLIEYSLFNRGNSAADMSWADFTEGMGAFAMNDLVDWCSQCGTESSSFVCLGLEATQMSNSTFSNNDASSRNGNSAITPAVAGAIGAAVTVVTMILLAAALLLFGFRLEHRGARDGASKTGGDLGVLKRSGSGNGGFKGAEKLASDTDLRLKGGAGASVVRHERVGSWELNENAAARKHSSLDKEIESGRVNDYARHSDDGFDNVNPFGDPVKPMDQV